MKVPGSNNWSIEEFVPKATFDAMGEHAIRCIHPTVLQFAIDFRSFLGRSMRVNDWADGGTLQFRGYRPDDCTVGAKWSSHRYGGALDFDVPGLDSQEVFEAILKLKLAGAFPGITRMESITLPEGKTRNWVHIDDLWLPKLDKNQIHIFQP